MPSNVEIVRGLYKDLENFTSGEPIEKSPHFSEKFKFNPYPASLGWPEMDKTAYIAHVNSGNKMSVSRKVVLNEIIDAGDKVISRDTTTMTLHDGSEVVLGPSASIISFDEGGKIVHIAQFLDSLAISKLIEKVKPQA
ncbi:hypothetical protein DL96DRAFT_1682984 [Flagelloscypha sp. PMI_526]|nr:hypothetical protein DL96DRAFT_1682984 [Flagelloscypha sp. PMI_526]